MFRWLAFMWENGTSAIKFVCVAAVFLVILQLVHTFRGSSPKPSNQTKGNTPQVVAQAPAQTTPSPNSASGNPSPAPAVPAGPTPAEIRSQLQVARDRLVEANVRADNALDSIGKWNSEIPPLLKTTAGDNIAAHEDLVESLTKIVSAKRTTESELKAKAKRIAAFRSDLGKRATSSTPTPLTTSEQEEIDDLEETVTAADIEWTRALNNARAVKLLADSRVEPDKQRSLEDEIKLKAAEDRLAELEQQLKQEKARRVEEAEAKREQEKLAAEREREKQRLAEKRKEEADAAAEKKRLEEEALIARARSAEVKATLAPFLKKRGVQPRKAGPGSIGFRATFDEAPMSLSALKGIGALEQSTEGLKWLARVAGSRKLPTPRWGVASQPGNWSEDDKELLKEAQQLLRELGPTLVKEKLLSP